MSAQSSEATKMICEVARNFSPRLNVALVLVYTASQLSPRAKMAQITKLLRVQYDQHNLYNVHSNFQSQMILASVQGENSFIT